MVLYAYSLCLFGAIWSVVVGLSMHRPHWFVTSALCLALAVVFPVFAGRPTGRRVTRRNQPALFDLVEAVAQRLGTPMPQRVWLTWNGGVETGAWPWRDLLVGQALVECLSAGQLSAVIAHELTILSHSRSWLTRRLHDAWSARVATAGKTGKDATLLARTAAFASAVDESADQATVAIAGFVAVSADAFALADMVRLEHFMYMRRVRKLSTDAGTAVRILDVDDGWRHLLGTGRGFFPPGVWNPPHLRLSHPGLAHAFAAAPPPQFGQARDRVQLAPLSRADRRRMSGERRESVFQRLPWRTFADISPDSVNDLAEQNFEDARRDVAELLDRAVPDDSEVISVLVHRAGDLEAQALGPDEDDDADDDPAEDPDDEGHSSWLLIEAAEFLLSREDWRLEHPAVQGVLISPDGRRVDLRPLRPEQIEELLTSEHALA
jgi:hypothetical protein